MKLAEVDLAPYEGLVRTTAARYAPFIIDHDAEDIEQILRLKIAQAVAHFVVARDNGKGVRSYVFTCVTNQIKDLLKEQKRLNARRQGGPLFLEGMGEATLARIERDMLHVTAEETYVTVEEEEIRIPSNLTLLERSVLVLLLLDLNQTEIARQLGVTRQRVRCAHRRIREKMADWAPDSVQDAEPFLQAA